MLITEIGGRRVEGNLESDCDAVEGVSSGDSRSVRVIAGARGRSQTVRVEFE